MTMMALARLGGLPVSHVRLTPGLAVAAEARAQVRAAITEDGSGSR